MTASQHVRTRNQSMDCAKLIASFFVVFIHVRFPEPAGSMVDYMGQFAVPMFFAITGYFNFGADTETIWRRIKHIFAIYLLGVMAQVLCILAELVYHGYGIVDFVMRLLPDQKGLTRWVVTQDEFIAGHLWYLHALLVVYLLYWLYVRFYNGRTVNYGPLYYGAFGLFLIYFTVRVLVPVYVENPTDITRNGYLAGIPMFALGLFLHDYQDRIFSSFPLSPGVLLAGIVAGELLTLQQWMSGGGGMALGTLIAVLALLLLTVRLPVISEKAGWCRFARKCGKWSMYIYLFHLPLAGLYGLLIHPLLTDKIGESAQWIQPVAVLLISWVFAAALDGIEDGIKSRRKK